MTLMAAVSQYGQLLLVTICEIERGVFYATYRQGDAALHDDELPSYQVGNSAAAARRQIERGAHALGYHRIEWTQTISAPLFPPHAEPPNRRPATAYQAPRLVNAGGRGTTRAPNGLDLAAIDRTAGRITLP